METKSPRPKRTVFMATARKPISCRYKSKGGFETRPYKSYYLHSFCFKQNNKQAI